MSSQSLSAEEKVKLRRRLDAAVELARRGATDGEKNAAKGAIERICARLDCAVPDLNAPPKKEAKPYYTPPQRPSYADPIFFERDRGAIYIRFNYGEPVDFWDMVQRWADRAARTMPDDTADFFRDMGAEYGVDPEDLGIVD